MVKDNGAAAKLANSTPTNVADAAGTGVKDGTIAGGIALQAMAKGGKFANSSDGDAHCKGSNKKLNCKCSN
ncbi:Variable outer membrane protein (plasmid) [Borrelia coriaceae ATCC 43381]|uniref:Variable large protein n=1 Tax=Borrelia coriaceae ATCC 43381 TaxID=1408429 RepID=W5SX11_9SPIR|nr:Variable outer membrane protein [Borrelia coriaceae ATCC 43381]